jgi:6,7-dimethyl-8-ribityllumazine synthase
MASTHQNLSSYDKNQLNDGSSFSFGVVVSEWNRDITNALFEGCLSTLKEHGVMEENIFHVHVPGSFELTSGAKMLISSKLPDAVICLGCVIKGETRHDEYINLAVANGLTNLSLASGVPCIFGLLTTENMQQAKDRAGGAHGNKGVEAAVTALKMASLKRELKKPSKKIGY